MQDKGIVYLVGAGPGDVDLITVKALELIKKADVIVYDYLSNKRLLDNAKKGVEIIYVGKKGGDHTLPQDDINRLIVDRAAKGCVVVRLKGGDPFVFGRGGEEAEEILSAGLMCEVVPGVTSAAAVPAYAGIPLTHRDYTSSVSFITGHERFEKDKSSIDWEHFGRIRGTLVFLMGIKNLEHIALMLMQHGRSKDTPAALIRWGTTPRQQTLVSTLENIAYDAKQQDFKPPAIFIVGDVVNLRNHLSWFENRPLFGKTIVVTRAREQASGLLKILKESGAECLEFPTIKIIPPESWEAIDKSIESISEYQWIIFTSVNGVKYFFKRLVQKGYDSRRLARAGVVAIGPKTASTLEDYGIVADIVPDSYRAESIISVLLAKGINGQKILIPRAREARDILPAELLKHGAMVDVVTAYETVMPESGTEEIINRLLSGTLDMVTFTSSSTVTNFLKMLKGHDVKDLLKDVALASIGPITSGTIIKNGLNVKVEAEEFTIDGLITALKGYFAEKKVV